MIKRVTAFFILFCAAFFCLQHIDSRAAGWLPLATSAGGGGGGIVSLAFTDTQPAIQGAACSGVTCTYSAGFGTANASRQIIIVAVGRSGSPVSVASVVIQGSITATKIIEQLTADNTNGVAIYIAAVPTGTTSQSVVVTYNNAPVRAAISVYSKIGGSITAGSSGGSVAANPTATLTPGTNGIVIGGSYGSASNAGNWSATNMTLDANVVLDGTNTYGAGSTQPGQFTASTSFTLSAGIPSNDVGAFAAWGP